MSKLEEALQEKITLLSEEKDELEGSLLRVEAQLELCQGLLEGEIDDPLEPVPKKKRGRPKKTVTPNPIKKRGRPPKKKADTVKEERLRQQFEDAGPLPDGGPGTTKEEQERAIRRFNPLPRPSESYGSVQVGSEKGKPAGAEPDPTGHKTISVDDED